MPPFVLWWHLYSVYR